MTETRTDLAGVLELYEHREDRESPPSWTWLTGESWTHGAPLLLTVRARPAGWESRLPPAVAALFSALADRIAAGLRPNPGSVIGFGPDVPWSGYPAGVVLAPAAPIPGVAVPKHALAIIGLHASELAALAEVGKGRVLGHLARFERSTLFVRSSDWRRPPLTDRFGVALTKLAQTLRIAVPDWSCVNRGSGLTIRVLEGGDGKAAELASLTAGAIFSFLTDPAWEAQAAFPWPPPPQEQERPDVLGAWSNAETPATGSAGSSPAFVAVTLAESVDSLTNMEDGLLLHLKPSTVALLVDALAKRTRLDLDFPDRTVFRVRWASRTAAPLKIAEKDQPAPERAPVPLPAPTFAATGRWQTFTTPFARVYPEVRKKG